MTPEQMQAVILAVLGLFGTGGIWAWLSARHKPGIDRETAAVANASEVTDKALAIAQHADDRAKRVEDRVDALETRLSRWVAFGHDLIVRWPVHRASDTPPTLPE